MSDWENLENNLEKEIVDAISKYILSYKLTFLKNHKLINKEDMLYPQYSREFTSIGEDEFKILQKKAAELLASSRESASPYVVKHWISIINGVVPFGYTLKHIEKFDEFLDDE